MEYLGSTQKVLTGMSISALTSEVEELSLRLLVTLRHNETGYGADYERQYDRFKTWVNDVGASTQGSESLDRSLVTLQSLQSTVVELLGDLTTAIDEGESDRIRNALCVRSETG